MCKLCKDHDGFKQDLVLLETENFFVMANLFPIGEYSFLIIPKRHVSSLVDTTKDEASELIDLQKMLMAKIKSNISNQINCFINEGPIAGQTIPHLHLHVVARFENDGIQNFKRNSQPLAMKPNQLQKHKDLLS